VQCFKHGKREDINAAVYKWFCQARSKTFPLGGSIIQERALDLAKDFSDLDIKAFNGWLDNAISHSDSLRLSNVTRRFFPPNTTSLLQPLDLGIIRAFKARYRKHLIRSLIAKMDSCTTVTVLTRSLSVLDAIFWIAKSWDETSAITISKCFAAAGFCVTPPETDDEDLDDDDNFPIADLMKRSLLKIDGYDDVSKHTFHVCVGSFVQMYVSSSVVRNLYWYVYGKCLSFQNPNAVSEMEELCPTEETYSGEWKQRIVDDIVGQRQQVEDNSDDDEDVNDVSEMSTINIPTTLKYDRKNSYLQEIK